MSFHPVKSVVMGCALALFAATPGLAKDGAETTTTRSVVDSKPGSKGSPANTAMGGMPGRKPCETCPLPINHRGGTAIINFVAPISSKTMANLAETAQNAVIGGADAIRINISSRGGSLHAIQFGVNVLKNLPVPVETVAMSQIASAAVALYCAGEKRYMADGAALYLHQQRGYEEIQVKTATAVVRELELSTRWYDDLLHACAREGVDRTMLDYSARDVVIDSEQATSLGMVTAPMKELAGAKTWGLAMNVTAPDSAHSGVGYPYPSYQ